jgi:hypothetical protein
LYNIQINAQQKYTYKIHIVDSDSENLIYYNRITKVFPDVEIHLIKNKNYEYGAWKYLFNKYPNFDIYCCIPDSIHIDNYIDLDVINDKTTYTFHHNSGYNSHITIKHLGIENLQGSRLNYESIIDTNFNLAQYCSFIVNNKTLSDIFTHLIIPPISKEGSCFYERNFGIFFLDKCINTINLHNYMHKISGGRSI